MVANDVVKNEKPSSGKSRRLRATSVRNRMWQSLITSKSSVAPQLHAKGDDTLSLIYSKLGFLESLILDVHWGAIGQFQQSQPPCFSFAAPAPVANSTKDMHVLGTPSCLLAQECRAARMIQKEWRRVSNIETFSPKWNLPPSVGSWLLQPQRESSQQIPSESNCPPNPYASRLEDCIWKPSTSDIFAVGTKLRFELENEAASILQSFARTYLQESSDVESSLPDNDLDVVDHQEAVVEDRSSDDEGSNDDNDPVDVAVMRAFFHTIDDNTYSNTSVPGLPEMWSCERILASVGDIVDQALDSSDKHAGARTVWTQWASIERHVPQNLRKGIVKTIEAKLQRVGFPTLRELVT